MDMFLAEDTWLEIQAFVPEEKKKALANSIIDMFEDEGVDFDYDADLQIFTDAGINEVDTEDEEDLN
jgi:protein associated with RNAse G/E